MLADSTIAQVENKVSDNDLYPKSVRDLKSLFAGQKLEVVETGEPIFREGGTFEHVYSIVDGMVRVFASMDDGRRVISGFKCAGSLLTVSSRLHHFFSAEAATVVKLQRLCRLRFDEEIMRSPELRPQVFARVCDEMTATRRRMDLLALTDETERMDRFLGDMSHGLPRHRDGLPIFDVPANSDIADCLDLPIEAVERCMTKLSATGRIVRVGRTAIVYRPDPSKMAIDMQDGPHDSRICAKSTQQAVWP